MASAQLPTNLVVGTMCHCDEPDECEEHWRFFTNPVGLRDDGHLRSGCSLTELEMRAIADLVRAVMEGQEDQQ